METVSVLAGSNREIDAGTGFAAFLLIEAVLCVFTFFFIRMAKTVYWDDWRLVRGRDIRASDVPGLGSGAWVRFAGSAVPGPDGPLLAPLSGEPCVWWRVKTAEFGTGAGADREEYAKGPLLIEDRTGGLEVDPGERDIRGSTHTLRQESEPEDRPGVRVVRNEYVIKEGTRLQVTGWSSEDADGRPLFLGSGANVLTVGMAEVLRGGLFKGVALVMLAVPFHVLVIVVLVEVASYL